jgi:GntR family transcriptional regulator
MGKKSKYVEIRERILEDYGSWLEGEAIPGERDLARKYGVTRSAVQYALKSLVQGGRIYRIPGKGTFVRQKQENPVDLGGQALQGNKGISALIKSYGIKISNQLLVSGLLTGSRFLEEKLQLSPGEPVFALHRVRYGNDEPLVVEYTYVPKALFPDIDEMDFSMVSLYDYMDAYGHIPRRFDQRLRLVRLSPKEARYLELPVDAPAYYSDIIGIDDARRVVEYTESYARCDKTEFRFTARA